MRTLLRLAVIVTALFLSGTQDSGCAQPQPQSHRSTLQTPTEIQGYRCTKGYAWFFTKGPLRRCTVTQETAFGEASIPAGSMIALRSDGTPDFVQLSHDSMVAGVQCLGGSWLGVAEGSVVAFYPSGKMRQCFLAGDQTVQGVPCMNGGIFGDGIGSGAKFHENGKLESCKLTKDFGTFKRGDRFVQAP